MDKILDKLRELEKRIEALESNLEKSDMIVCMPPGGIIRHQPWKKTVM